MATEKSNRVMRHTRSVVELLASEGSLTAADAAQKLGIPRPSAYRLLSALNHAGLAKQDDEGLVSLTNVWLSLGDAALRAASAWFTRDDVLEHIRDQTGLTVYLSVPRPGRTVCIRRLHGRSYQILVLHPGGSLPLHLGGVGRVTLAFGDEADDYLEGAPFEPATPHSLTTRQQLTDDVRLTRREGATLSDQDVTLRVAALAVPVLDPGDRLLAALSVAGRREDVVARVSALKTILLDGVEEIRRKRH